MPDGTLFVSAGWFTFLGKDTEGSILVDRGTAPNVDAFCAALS